MELGKFGLTIVEVLGFRVTDLFRFDFGPPQKDNNDEYVDY